MSFLSNYLSVAAAVEGSELVLMCMSQKYKDSPNCRLEGEYCINSKIPFIPLMMQQGYQPDGWYDLSLLLPSLSIPSFAKLHQARTSVRFKVVVSILG